MGRHALSTPDGADPLEANRAEKPEFKKKILRALAPEAVQRDQRCFACQRGLELAVAQRGLSTSTILPPADVVLPNGESVANARNALPGNRA